MTITVSLNGSDEQRIVATAFKNQIQNRVDIAAAIGTTPNTVQTRLERGRDRATEGYIQFDDQLDADVFAVAIREDYLMAEQASVTSTFTADEQAQITEGLATMQNICIRIENALGDKADTLPVELPSNDALS